MNKDYIIKWVAVIILILSILVYNLFVYYVDHKDSYNQLKRKSIFLEECIMNEVCTKSVRKTKIVNKNI